VLRDERRLDELHIPTALRDAVAEEDDALLRRQRCLKREGKEGEEENESVTHGGRYQRIQMTSFCASVAKDLAVA
jgi:hypothetical protein